MTRHELYPAGIPRFNHIAMSMAEDQLDATGREDICRFWGEVFGFEEHPQMTEDRRRLVLGACHYEQFVFLIAEDEPMACPRLDHFGLSVKSLDDLTAAHRRAEAFAATDDRVHIIPPSVDDYEVVKIHSFYAGYILPMMCELQFWEFAS
ncbi:MAG TPA: hypothetical protein VJM33_18630 [Microthrixaceae bacterium]|nr:hypothetical protein [Microthrixaceae bacterium]